MEENIEMPTTKSIVMKWGPILGLISIGLILITALGELQRSSAMNWIGIIPTIAIIYLAHKEYKDTGDGFMSYGKGLGLGTLIVVVSSLISSIFFYIYIKFIDTNYVQILKDIQLEGMQEQGMGDAQIEQAMKMSENFMTPEMMFVFGIVIGVFFGFLVSLVVSAITKNNNPALEV
ncbi:MAG TPA: DUF4199 domain-containing protein [Fulvivirga sp.]|nr:DUF4199 domain-containing protein [Fulvivirga sp.]